MNKANVVPINNGILLTPKKNEIGPFTATRMALEIAILNEVRRRKANITRYHLHVKYFKMVQTNLFIKRK